MENDCRKDLVPQQAGKWRFFCTGRKDKREYLIFISKENMDMGVFRIHSIRNNHETFLYTLYSLDSDRFQEF